MTKKIIGILFGGCSSEYEVSLQSAAAVIRAADPARFTLIPVGITRQGQWYRFYGTPEEIEQDRWVTEKAVPAILSPDRSSGGLLEFAEEGVRKVALDAVLPMLHGKNGEDGTVQGLLALAGIPCIGCGLLSSALCMDKSTAHLLASQAGVKVPRSVLLDQMGSVSDLAKRTEDLAYPLFVKPVNAGSSFGITKITGPGQLADAVSLAFRYDSQVIVEEAVEGFEVGCAVMGTSRLFLGEVDEIELSSGFFDYEEKYTLKTSKIHMPARIDEATAQRIKDTAVLLYRALHCSGFARVDLFLTPSGEIVFNEINTIPGFTSHSRYPNMMKGAGLSFEETVNRLLDEGVRA